MERGYIKLWRKMMDSKHFSMSLKHIGLFDYLLLKANWKPGYFRGQKIEPGQMATSITHLAETVGEQRHKIKRILNDLESAGMINRWNVSNRYVMITICNWNTYQSETVGQIPTRVQPESNRVPQSKKGKKEIPYNEVVGEWNGRCEDSGLSRVHKLTEARRRRIRKILDAYSLEEMLYAFDNFHADRWRRDNAHQATFDIALRDENMAKYFEMQGRSEPKGMTRI